MSIWRDVPGMSLVSRDTMYLGIGGSICGEVPGMSLVSRDTMY